MSELESVRIGKCQNWKVSELESVRTGKRQNWKMSIKESVRIGKCPNRKVSELESFRTGKHQNWKVSDFFKVLRFLIRGALRDKCGSIVPLSEGLSRLKRAHLKGLNLMNKLIYHNLRRSTSGGLTEDFKRYTSSDPLQLTLMVL